MIMLTADELVDKYGDHGMTHERAEQVVEYQKKLQSGDLTVLEYYHFAALLLPPKEASMNPDFGTPGFKPAWTMQALNGKSFNDGLEMFIDLPEDRDEKIEVLQDLQRQAEEEGFIKTTKARYGAPWFWYPEDHRRFHSDDEEEEEEDDEDPVVAGLMS
jgi:hypothetical protein